MRLINLIVIGILVFAAAHVYRIKMESTARTERVMRLHGEIRDQRESIAALRTEWSRLESPQRVQQLADKHLALKPIDPTQFDALRSLPDRPPNVIAPANPDPIGAMINTIEPELSTGSVPDNEDR